MAAPKYNVGTVIYFVESAKAGQIESYKVSQARQGSDGLWWYGIGVPSRPPPVLTTMTDRNNGVMGLDWEIGEAEICDLCTALDLAYGFHQDQLAKIQALRLSHCGTG